MSSTLPEGNSREQNSQLKSRDMIWNAVMSRRVPTIRSSKIVLSLMLCWLFVALPAISLARRSAVPATKTLTKARSASVVLQTPRRQNELLVRFRGAPAELQKDLVASSHGLRRQKTLRGQSGIEKLQLVSASDVE